MRGYLYGRKKRLFSIIRKISPPHFGGRNGAALGVFAQGEKQTTLEGKMKLVNKANPRKICQKALISGETKS